MTVFRLTGGTTTQRAIVRLALADVSVTCSRGEFVARANGPKCRQIVLDQARFTRPDDDCEGYLHRPTPRSLIIALHPTLPDSKLYGVLLHELGHFFGLEHRATGLMAPYYEQRSWGKLTLALRRRLSRELAQLILQQTLAMIA